MSVAIVEAGSERAADLDAPHGPGVAAGSPLDVVVPTAVRVEAGWDRRAPAAALINHLRISDMPLEPASANVAADLMVGLHASVADAHIGATVHAIADREPVTIVTSDPDDMAAVVDPVPATIVTI